MKIKVFLWFFLRILWKFCQNSAILPFYQILWNSAILSNSVKILPRRNLGWQNLHVFQKSFSEFFSRFFRVFWLYFVLPAPNIYVTGLSFFGLFSSMLDFFRVFRLYLSFRQLPMYTSLDSQQSDNFVGHLDSDFNYFGNFPIIKFSCCALSTSAKQKREACDMTCRCLIWKLRLSYFEVA